MTVVPAPGYSASEAQAAAEDAATTFLNPETWTIGATVVVGALSRHRGHRRRGLHLV